MPDGVVGDEVSVHQVTKFLEHISASCLPECHHSYPKNCLSLDIYTSNVVYEELQPVVVFIGGSDLKEDQEVRPTSSAAKKHKVVFVDVGYRLGALGFLSLKSLALQSYPQYSGNYGLGDVITALEWIQLNIQHFGGHPHKVQLPTNK